MSSDTKWIIGTVVVLAGLLSAQIAGVNARNRQLVMPARAACMGPCADDRSTPDGIRFDARIDSFGDTLTASTSVGNSVIPSAGDQRLLTRACHPLAPDAGQ